jgi:hypothetical protein
MNIFVVVIEGDRAFLTFHQFLFGLSFKKVEKQR